ncbi:uncharacterized protein LOC110687550 [Chenopodium quinoa]|uniref:uncharacterized protein LOC110687550 n=1 Tax=Chenopodium quinoa TaxID=63459 RepID=UPI000B77D76F|nr:uncharacterized protein LOC110687550 [Chenopodium quinoa]
MVGFGSGFVGGGLGGFGFERKGEWNWQFSKNGKIDVRSAYNLLTMEKVREQAASSSGNVEFDWNIIWQNLANRGMIVDTICPMCGEDSENALHMIVKSRDVRLLWHFSPLRLEVDEYGGENFKEWCSMVRGKYKESQWRDIFWCIVWLRRNAWLFNRKRVEQAGRRQGSYAPIAGTIKINSDAAMLNDNQVGLGGVMREFEGDVGVSTCVVVKGVVEVDVAEAMALRHAVIALDSGFRNVCLESENGLCEAVQLSRKCHGLPN